MTRSMWTLSRLTRRLAPLAVLAGVSIASCATGTNGDARHDSTSRPTTTMPSTTAPTTTTTLGPDAILDRTRNSMIRIRNTGCGELSVGSAWLAGDHSVITNHHVVEGDYKIEMLTWDGIDLTPRSVDVADDLDIARLHGDWSAAPSLTALPVRTTRVEVGERIAIVGFPEGKELTVSTGVAVGYGPEPDTPTHEVLKLTTIVKHGNSGGPAIDVNGEVVGVVFAEELATDEALVIPIQSVMALTPANFAPQSSCR